jgi:hypothetical protein
MTEDNKLVHVPNALEGDVVPARRTVRVPGPTFTPDIRLDPFCIDVPNELRKLAHLIESRTVSGTLVETEVTRDTMRIVLDIKRDS